MPRSRGTYVCAECLGEFEHGWSDEEAQAESVEVFGVRGDAPGMVIVCDDCYQAIVSGLPTPVNVVKRFDI